MYTHNRTQTHGPRQNRDGTTDEERERLDTVGVFHVGEFVNRCLVLAVDLVYLPAYVTVCLST